MDYSAFHWSEKARKYAETIGTIFNVKGRVNKVQDLPSTGNKVGDLWLVGLTTDPDLTEYAWLSFDNVTRWEKLGSTATSLAFSAITGSPNDNVALKNALDGKYSTSNPNGYISGITSAMVTTALGYTPYNSSNPSGYITGITSAMVTTALGYTPQQQLVSGTNIKTINGVSLLGSGDISTSDSTKANTSLSNLDLTGQAVIDSKVDLDAQNLSNAGKSLIAGLPMPTATHKVLTAGASGTEYTASSTGWVQYSQKFSNASHLTLVNKTTAVCDGDYGTGNSTLNGSIPVSKGDTFVIYYTGTTTSGTDNKLWLVYAKGSESEAS